MTNFLGHFFMKNAYNLNKADTLHPNWTVYLEEGE